MRSHLSDRAVIGLSGPEARGFLQGLITNDIEKLASGAALYAALLTPQGKILFDFLLADDAAGGIWLNCAAGSRDALVKRLSMYRLRAKVEIGPRDDLAVIAGWDEQKPDGAFSDPRVAGLGWRKIGPEHEAADADYLSHRLSLGVPEGADFGSDKTFALDGDLEELHAVSFDKGCYVGQELTARMKHRGTARKRLLPVTAESPLPQPGTAVMAGQTNIGEITSAYGARGFALIRLDRLEETKSHALAADGIAVNVTKPSWLSA